MLPVAVEAATSLTCSWRTWYCIIFRLFVVSLAEGRHLGLRHHLVCHALWKVPFQRRRRQEIRDSCVGGTVYHSSRHQGACS